MKVDHLENLSFPVGLLAHDYLNGIAEVVKEVFTEVVLMARKRTSSATGSSFSYRAKRMAAPIAASLCRMRSGGGPGILGFKNSWVPSQSSRICRASTEELTAIRHGQDVWL
jgi:hypothetical protein